jgi:hypothetical protein
LWKVPVTGGAPQKVPATRAATQIKCLPDGRILFSGDVSGIWLLNPATGASELLVGPKDTSRSGRYLWPEMMPGNGAVLFSIWQEGRATLCAFSLRERKLIALVESALRPRYVAAARYLLYQSDRQLFAVPFDRDALKITGEARLVADEVGNGAAYDQEFDVSPAGVLVYLPPRDAELVWKDRAGKITVLPFKPRRYGSVDLSTDGRQAVLNVQEGTARRIYRADLDRGEPLTRLTPGDDDWFGLFLQRPTGPTYSSCGWTSPGQRPVRSWSRTAATSKPSSLPTAASSRSSRRRTDGRRCTSRAIQAVPGGGCPSTVGGTRCGTRRTASSSSTLRRA